MQHMFGYNVVFFHICWVVLKCWFFSHRLCCFDVYIHMPYCFVVSFLIHMLHCCLSSYTWYVLMFLFHMLWFGESVKEWYIYIVVFIICCAIILLCCICLDYRLGITHVFSPILMRVCLKICTKVRVRVAVRFQDMCAGLVRLHPHPVAMGVIGIPNIL
jgi:hypothetical protein